MDRDKTNKFIMQHRTDDVRSLALRGSREADIDMPFALDQIAGWQTACKKLPSWAKVGGIIYPPHLNMEQCSSEATARYKASVMARLIHGDDGSASEGNAPDGFTAYSLTTDGLASDGFTADGLRRPTLVDLTGGFGVDFSFMATLFSHAVYVERDEKLCAIARNNLRALRVDNAEVVSGDGVEYLKSLPVINDQRIDSEQKSSTPSFIFVDPARRDAHGRRVFGIEDCTPDVLALKAALLSRASTVMIKLSPMLDWHAAAKAFGKSCREVHIVAVDNECKELLLVLSASTPSKPFTLYCVNDGSMIKADANAMAAKEAALLSANPDEWRRERYLYVPNASIMKAGIFARLTQRYPMRMADADSHLFFSDTAIPRFPGRRFTIEAITSMNKQALRQHLAGITKANIAVRNFPLSAEALRKRLGLKAGGDTFIFGTTARGRHVVIIAKKA